MKYVILILALLAMECKYANAQVDTTHNANIVRADSILFNKYLERMRYADKCYRCSDTDRYSLADTDERQAVQHDVIDDNLGLVFSSVILGNENEIQTGTAFAYTQDATNGTLSANFSTLGASNDNAWNFGVKASGKGNLFNLYSDNSWLNETGLSVGLTVINGRNSQYFDSRECDSLRRSRWVFISKQLTSYRNTILKNKKEFITRIKIADSLLIYSNHLTNFQDFDTSVFNFKKIEEQRNSDSITLMEINRVVADDSIMQSKDSDKLSSWCDEVIRQDVVKFDSINDIVEGYRVSWLDFKLSLSNVTSNLVRDSLPSLIKSSYNQINYPKFSFTFTYSRSKQSENILSFFQPQISINRSSFLDAPYNVKTPYLKYDSSSSAVGVWSGDKVKKLGDYDKVSLNFWTAEIGIYGAIFLGDKHQFGIDARGSFRTVLFNGLPGVSQPSSFSAFIGPVIRIDVEKDFSKAMIGVKVGLLNALVGSHVWHDAFSAKLEIGVPFHNYEGKKQTTAVINK